MRKLTLILALAAIITGCSTGSAKDLTTSGTIMATEVNVAPEVAGSVTEVLVEEGAKVARGDAVVRLDTAVFDLQVQQASAALQLAEARLAEVNAGARPDQPRLGAAAEQIRQLEAAVAQARATRDLAQLNQSKSTVKAPIAGVVLHRLVEPGALVAPGAALATLANLDDLWLRVYVPENQLDKVRLGMRVSVAADAFPKQTFKAEVVQISDKAEFTPRNVQTKEERVSTVYAVKLKLREGLGGELKPGMPADVTFPVANAAGR